MDTDAILNAANTSVNIVDSDRTGFAALTSEDFMTLLLTQLQNQDPTEPTSNEELLNQLSSMQSLASSIELSDTLEGIVSNQQLTDGANFLGSLVTGDTDDGVQVSGVADRVVMREGTAYLGIGLQEVPVRNVTEVNYLFLTEQTDGTDAGSGESETDSTTTDGSETDSSTDGESA